MKSVFIVWHTHETETSADEKLIGVYISRIDAVAAIDRLKSKPGFNTSPEGFEVDEYVIGKDHWTEGYISEEEALLSSDE